MCGRPVQRFSSVEKSFKMRGVEEFVTDIRKFAKTKAGFDKVALGIRRSGTAVRHGKWGSFGEIQTDKTKQKPPLRRAPAALLIFLEKNSKKRL